MDAVRLAALWPAMICVCVLVTKCIQGFFDSTVVPDTLKYNFAELFKVSSRVSYYSAPRVVSLASPARADDAAAPAAAGYSESGLAVPLA